MKLRFEREKLKNETALRDFRGDNQPIRGNPVVQQQAPFTIQPFQDPRLMWQTLSQRPGPIQPLPRPNEISLTQPIAATPRHSNISKGLQATSAQPENSPVDSSSRKNGPEASPKPANSSEPQLTPIAAAGAPEPTSQRMSFEVQKEPQIFRGSQPPIATMKSPLARPTAPSVPLGPPPLVALRLQGIINPGPLEGRIALVVHSAMVRKFQWWTEHIDVRSSSIYPAPFLLCSTV
jgi:hypothetical protein